MGAGLAVPTTLGGKRNRSKERSQRDATGNVAGGNAERLKITRAYGRRAMLF